MAKDDSLQQIISLIRQGGELEMMKNMEEPKVEFVDIIDIVATSPPLVCGSEACNLQGCDEDDF